MSADTPLTPGSPSAGPLPFAVTGSGDLALAADRTGATTFTVTNLTGRPLRVRLQPKGTDAAQDGWYRMAGDTEVPIAVGATISVEVRAKVPNDVAEGAYPMFLRAVDEGDPELLTDGQPVSVTVPKAAPTPTFPLVPVLIAALVLLLIGGGAIWWFLIRKVDPPVAAPVNRAVPVVTGTAKAGETLSATNGDWDGAPTFSYAWISCDEMANNCAPIAGASAATYLLTDADTKRFVRVKVSATNAAGSSSAESTNTGPIGVGQVKVPNVKGERYSLAAQLLAERGLGIESTNIAKPTWCSRVLTQSPGTNSLVDKGSVVQVTVDPVKFCFLGTFAPKATLIPKPIFTP